MQEAVPAQLLEEAMSYRKRSAARWRWLLDAVAERSVGWRWSLVVRVRRGARVSGRRWKGSGAGDVAVVGSPRECQLRSQIRGAAGGAVYFCRFRGGGEGAHKHGRLLDGSEESSV